MPDKLNIIIGVDNPSTAGLLKKICASISGINLVGIALSERMLVAKINSTNPDLILLSLNDTMGGIDVIHTIRDIDQDLNLIVLYNPNDHDSDNLINALEMGVYECIEKPGAVDSIQYKQFRLRLLTIAGLLTSRKRFSKRKEHHYRNKFFMPSQTRGRKKKTVPSTGKADIVVIASSTGGPEILSRIFSILPGNLNVPILLVQHIPEKITRYFAKSLNEKSELEIFQAGHGDIILPSKVYIAPGGQHMTISRPDTMGHRTIMLNKKAPINSVRPSADLLFESIAESYLRNVLAIVLTGMGEDGKKGVSAMKKKGCFCITQKSETCVVYGMPRAVDEAGLSDESLDPLSITQRIVTLTQNKRF
ncbi:MAG: response regulator [Desulfobacula sp.]|nr:response regulator [Desulfobacula sp.]